MDFFERVKILVKSKTSMTLRGFIEAQGLNYETYYSGRRLNNLPRADETYKIARALDVSMEYLLTGKETNPDTQKLNNLLTQLQELINTTKSTR